MGDVLALPHAPAPGPHRAAGTLDDRRLDLLPARADGGRRCPWSRCCSASPSDAGKILIVALVGVLMIVYVTIGGMKGTTWVQMVKAVLLIAGAILLYLPGPR